MKVLFGAQGSILRVFCELDRLLRARGVVDSSAYWISDSEFYYSELDRSDYLLNPDIFQLYEWTFTSKTSMAAPRMASNRKRELEERYQQYGLWNAIVADRRLMYGTISKARQNYAGRFGHASLCNIVFNALDALDRLVVDYRPDAIVTFVPATFGDYLLALVAQSHGVNYFQLRSTKLGNYVTFAETLGATLPSVLELYERNLSFESKFPFEEESSTFIRQAAAAPLDYEGTINMATQPRVKSFITAAKRLPSVIRHEVFPANSTIYRDNHVPPAFLTWLHGTLHQPKYRRKALRLMKKRMLKIDAANACSFVFYPLHSEPEIALSVYGRDHQNQIETIRRLAQSIPLGWVLLVKEHPRSLGYRSSGWYERLLEIPNVYFADPSTRPFYWIEKAKAIVTVSGFVGFEALVLGKPVVVLGDVAFSMLPRTMIRKIDSLSDFGRELIDLLNSFAIDIAALKAFVAATMESGVAVNLYSDLLAKPGRNKEKQVNIERQFELLSNLLISKLAHQRREM